LKREFIATVKFDWKTVKLVVWAEDEAHATRKAVEVVSEREGLSDSEKKSLDVDVLNLY